MKIKHCNDDKLAVLLKKIPLISMQLGHAKVHGTVRDYLISSETNIELDFVCDLFTMSTKEIIEKWYGGESEAFNLLHQIDGIEQKHDQFKEEV
ncbi:hypothetical protein [Sporosarcina sp. E16_8]|uniref:hypothetical protein n=1 Tax=Sporosarcina sp. E16_8 TaxID=2789295 RepID=UPI001A93A298|nr:hypothetical protein [Sporosarcina sp. E16_8]MBO0589600.1 hypothetical protein [Sporosarcina sp. E16_8]